MKHTLSLELPIRYPACDIDAEVTLFHFRHLVFCAVVELAKELPGLALWPGQYDKTQDGKAWQTEITLQHSKLKPEHMEQLKQQIKITNE